MASLRRSWPWLLAAVPPALVLCLIAIWGVNVPFADQWEVARFFASILDGQFQWGDLAAPHNEHRILVPRLIFLGLAAITGWNVKAEMLVSWLLACVNLWLLYRLILRSLGDAASARLHVLLLSPVIFSLVQYENWLLGMQIMMFLPVTCLLGSLWAIGSPMGVSRQTIAVIVLSTISTWTVAAGLLSFVLLAPLMVFVHWPRIKSLRGPGIIWVVALGVNTGLYFVGYQRPPDQAAAMSALQRPADAAAYLLTYLGSPFGFVSLSHPLLTCRIAGGAVLIGFLTAAILAWRLRADRRVLQSLAPWFILGLTAIAYGLLTVVGRVGLGQVQALSSRYTTASMLLGIADFMLISIWLRACRPNGRILGAALACILAGSSLVSSYTRLPQMHAQYYQRLRARSVLSCINFIRLAPLITTSFRWEAPAVLAAVPALDRRGWLYPPLLATSHINTIAAPADPNLYGSIEQASTTQDELLLQGWAALDHRHSEPAHAILICYETTDADPIIFMLALDRLARPDIAARFGYSGQDSYGWQVRYPLQRLPPNVKRITAYGLDCLSSRAYLLGGSLPTAALSRPP